MTWADRGDPVFERRGIVPAVDVDARVWAPAVSGVSVGGGVRVEIDARRVVIAGDTGASELAPMTHVVEFGVRVGRRERKVEGSPSPRHEGS